ncbi:MAG TPA: glycerophosphodiester phosphodiesterase [Gaiellaceae bacterium]|nr:glycerophosphodiester phosphodiesterase [Gaiellaceae bacterium]
MTPLVIAHRGSSWDVPENTLPAFERAIADGADFVELDVHARPTGELVVTHDPPRPEDDLPSLEEALDLIHGRIGVMVELKTPHRYRRHRVVERTLDLLTEDDVFVCFEPGAVALVRRLRPELRTVQHTQYVPIRLAARRGCWAAGFWDRHASPRALARAQRLGLETMVYTVNDPARMRGLAALAVSGIFTDRPALARQVLRAEG